MRYVVGKKGEDEESLLQLISLVLCLQFCLPSQPCSSSSLSSIQLEAIEAFEELGLLITDIEEEEMVFFPTPILSNLFLSSYVPANTISSSFSALGDIQIIVETNGQVVASSSSQVQQKLVEIFLDVHLSLPSMVVGRLSRNKVQELFRYGISADQIISFLQSSSHTVVKTKRRDEREEKGGGGGGMVGEEEEQLIPQSIADQLVLWEMELNRFSATKARLLELPSNLPQDARDGFAEKARGTGGVLWEEVGKEGETPILVLTENACNSILNKK